ncbi:MAG: hypothetical protein KME21_30710 [Desmonostoc vinosum HA7617-LM4]|jgi:hypothetical protein|nr:hypothetical protein [Desmonostoc vinosum HA7617-LM4]
MSKPKPQNNSLELSDLSGSVKSAIVFSDSHFGLESAVWQNAQRIADMLPIDVQVSGDLNEEIVLTAVDKAKGAELQAKNWGEYSTAISRYLKAFYKIKEKQSEVAENVAEARLKHAELEKELGTTLATLESKYRQVVGSYRSATAGTQDELEISLNRIATQYTKAKSARDEREQSEEKREETPYAKQTASLVDRFRKAREARYSGATAGITCRVS